MPVTTEASQDISGTTRVVAVIGDPVQHSRSPALHNAAFRSLDLDWVYVALPVGAAQGASAVDAMRILGLAGMNVTMPHKAAVVGGVDRLTPAAATLGVCNTLYWDGDEIVGDSTDGDGFVQHFTLDEGHEFANRRVVIVGAGGAARSIIEAVGRQSPASIVVVNRTATAAWSAAELAPMATVGPIDAVGDADIVINTTSIGMADSSHAAASPVPAELLTDQLVVADIVYEPHDTPLLVAARAAGAATVGGLGMLVRQGAIGFEYWTGCAAPLPVMFAALARPGNT
ncbi:MAG: shikimate dehydrogenase [Acidimicrobiales bacterium]